VTKILVTGANGQVGHALKNALQEYELVFAVRNRLSPRDFTIDLSNPASIRQTVEAVKPDIIINPAAYTAVDKAEDEKELATQINHHALKAFGSVCQELAIPIIHFSTDYVFDGSGMEPKNEKQPTKPVNHYGLSKRDGEVALLNTQCDAIILRTSWVFSAHGKNFVKTMLNLGQSRESLSIIYDQMGAPTSAEFLSQMVLQILKNKSNPKESISANKGIYHLTCAGEASWFDFANEIFALARMHNFPLKVNQVSPIPTSNYPTPALRPLNSRLDCSKFEQVFGVCRTDWRDALADIFPSLLQEL